MQGDCAMVLVAAVANVNIFLSVSAAGGATGTTSISETLAVGAAFGPPQICLRPGHVGMQDEPPCGLAWLGQWSWQTLGVSKRKLQRCVRLPCQSYQGAASDAPQDPSIQQRKLCTSALEDPTASAPQTDRQVESSRKKWM